MLPIHREEEAVGDQGRVAADENSDRLGTSFDALLVALMVLAFVIRLLTLNTPLERDEGEFAYGAQLLLAGVPPWTGLYSLKFPGIYVAYSLIESLFGQSRFGIHLGLAAVNALCACGVFFLGKSLFDPRAGLVAAAAYTVLSLSHGVVGIMGHATHFVMLFVLVGTNLLMRSSRSPHPGLVLLTAGALMGIGVTMKQHGGAFVLFGMTFIVTSALWSRGRFWATLRNIAWFGIGATLPVCLLLLFVWRSGGGEQFWFWTLTYAGTYASHAPPDILKWFSGQFTGVVETVEPIWILASIGLFLCLGMKKTRRNGVFLLQLAVFSFLAVSLGFYFRNHYFVMMLPAVSLCTAGFVFTSGILVKQLSKRRTLQWAPLLIVLLGLALSVHGQASFYLSNTSETISRKLYPGNPFVESVAIGRYLRQHSEEGDRVAILGSEPQILFYAGRRSATGFVYMYPLMEGHKWALPMQTQMIREIERAQPRFLVVVNMAASWLRSGRSESLIFDWAERVKEAGIFEQVGLVDFLSPTESVSYWGQESRGKKPSGLSWIEILERKPR